MKMAKNQQIYDTTESEKKSVTSLEGNDLTQSKSEEQPPSYQTSDDDLKEQNGNQPSAPFVSTGKTTVTLLSIRTLRHNGIEYKGGTTLDLPTENADFLIKNHYAVAGSMLPVGGIIVPKTHNPKAGSDVD